MTKPMKHNGIYFVAGGFLSALFLAGAAYAVTDTAFNYSTPKNGYFTIDRMAMAPTDDVAAASFSIKTGSGEGLADTGATRCFNSAVNLPHGATIVRLHVWFSSVAEADPEFSVLRQRLTDGLTHVVANIQTADDSGDRKVASANANASFAAVSNAQYSYGFRACIGQLDAFYAARILYTYTSAGD
jgi:hypothetical protein